MSEGLSKNINNRENDKFFPDKDDCTAVRVGLTLPQAGPGQELPVNLYKLDPITASLFNKIICELALIRQHMEVITGEKIKGD